VVGLLNIHLFLCSSRNKSTDVSSIPKGETATSLENRGLWPVTLSSKGDQRLLPHYMAGEENTKPSQNKKKRKRVEGFLTKSR
jgi:hypothetical protein